jgi:hypothetical protein
LDQFKAVPFERSDLREMQKSLMSRCARDDCDGIGLTPTGPGVRWDRQIVTPAAVGGISR